MTDESAVMNIISYDYIILCIESDRLTGGVWALNESVSEWVRESAKVLTMMITKNSKW